MLDDLTHIKADRLDEALAAIKDAFLSGKTEHVYTLSHKLAQGMPEEEIVVLAYAALRAMGQQACAQTIEHALRPTHVPLPCLDSNPKEDAKPWAANASQPELQAYAGASFRHMSPANQAKFKEWVVSQ